MTSVKKRVLSALLTIVLTLGLFAAMPLVASARTASQLADTINSYDPENGGAPTGQLTAQAEGNTVTVTGTVANATQRLQLMIDDDVTVIWKADISGSVGYLIYLGGNGTFEIPEGGKITYLDTTGSAGTAIEGGRTTIKISGGEIRSEGSGISSGNPMTIEMSGGLLETKDNAIGAQHSAIHISGGLVSSLTGGIHNLGNASVTVSGGTVRSGSSVAISTGLDGSSITISGGLVENDGSMHTISAKNFTMTGGMVRNPGTKAAISGGNCEISGGVISAKSGYAMDVGTNSSNNISGGFVFAYGTVLVRDKGNYDKPDNYVIEGFYTTPTIGGTAVICAWNQAAGRTVYTAGSSDDLVVGPAGASAIWSLEGGVGGIKYQNGSNTGFFPVEGVTVTAWTDASQWATDELQKAEALDLIPDTLLGKDLTQPITRGEFAAVAVKVYENLSGTKAIPAVVNPFSDTSDVEVLKAYNTNLMVGTSDSKFEPNVLLNREQCATALTRVYKRVTMPGWTLATDSQFTLSYTMPAAFADDANISDWAKDSVYFMAANKIIQGTGQGNFSPRATTPAEEAVNYASATREAALIIAVRMVENLG